MAVIQLLSLTKIDFDNCNKSEMYSKYKIKSQIAQAKYYNSR